MSDFSKKYNKVSIITVCYNILEAGRKDYFLQMFASVHNQTYPNIEHVIMDGASTDGTIEFIEQCITKQEEHYKTITSQNTITFQSEPDTGIYNAMNKGICVAIGEYVIFMNTDDYYATNDAIELLVTGLEKHNADFSCGTAELLDESNNKICNFSPKIQKFFYAMPFSHNSMLSKKQLFMQFGLFNTAYKIAADYDWIFNILLTQPAVYIVPTPPILKFRFTGVGSNQEHVTQELINIYKSYYSKNSLTEEDFLVLTKQEISWNLFLHTFYVKNSLLQKKLFYYLYKYTIRATQKNIKKWFHNA